MPHAIIEHSSNLEQTVTSLHILQVVHAIMETSALFDPMAIKTRRHITHDYIVGDNSTNGFVHVTVYLLQGRSEEVRKRLSDRIFQALDERMPHLSSLTVDIRELNAATYRKK